MAFPKNLYAVLTLMWTVAAGVGCSSSDSDLGDEEHVRTWINSASAVAVYQHAHDPIALADGQSPYPDPACPEISDDETTLVISGDCTDDTGTQWIGTATVVRSENGDRVLTLDAFGSFDDPDFEAPTTGTVELRRMEDALHAFDVSIVQDGITNTHIEYSGSVSGGYTGATVWNGSGEVERADGFDPNGTAHATTTDEVIDNSVCSGQPVSGQTTIEMDDDSAVVTYDGETDCDEDQNARWAVNGEDRGLISGISCSVGAVGARTAGNTTQYAWWMGTFLLGCVAVGRFRRRNLRRTARR